jgi:hypothetical protein
MRDVPARGKHLKKENNRWEVVAMSYWTEDIYLLVAKNIN